MNGKERNNVHLYLNGEMLTETEHDTFSESGLVNSTGGRVWTMDASAGDEIDIRADTMDGQSQYWRILFCTEFVPKM